MVSSRFPLLMFCIPLLTAQDTGSGYAGSEACRACHASQFDSQSKSGHAQALRKARPSDPGPGSKAQWAFGAGLKAITWVTQTGDETIAEHGMSYYSATKSLALTPGHKTSADLVYRTFDSVATALRCFRCHSTGPVLLEAGFQVHPSEPGVHCGACHGAGRAHAESGGAAAIQNPKRLSAAQINTLCGACHRQASDLDDERDWSNPWNVRHEPSYLHRAACFRNSDGALSCITCHDPHQPLKTPASAYDSHCVSCHPKAAHTAPVASRSCVGCHMPQVATGRNLRFTNHWIGIYDPRGSRLVPSKRVVQMLRPALVSPVSPKGAENGMVVPADPATLAPAYSAALAETERRSGPDSTATARAAANLGLFLLESGRATDAEVPLRQSLAIDERTADRNLDADRENLARTLDALGRRDEAIELYRKSAEGSTPGVAARSFVRLAALDRDNATTHYRNALAAEEKVATRDSLRLAVLLEEYALTLRAANRDAEAEPLLRRALAIQRDTARADPQVTIGILNTLGNLLEGARKLDEAESLERIALALSEEKLGPESTQLAMTCTNLADVLWNKKNLREAGLLYRRAVRIDASLYGGEAPETAADIANLGMLMGDAGQSASGETLLRQALAIYEKTLGPNSDQARFVRDRLAKPGR